MKVIITGDFHVPYHDMAAIEAAMKYTRRAKPDLLVLNGDITDCFQLSRFIKDPKERSLKDELVETEEVLHMVDRFTPTNTEIIYQGGNHEERITKYLWTKARELDGLISLPELLKLKDKDITYRPYNKPLDIEGVIVKHGSRISSIGAGYSVKKELDSEGCSTIIGHSHRLAIIYRSLRYHTIYGVEGGHLCDTSRIDYMRGKPIDWAQGFVELIETKHGLQPVIHHIVKGEVIT